MSGLRQFNDYKNYSFFFKKFDTLESFKEAGEKAIEDFLASGKPKGEYSYFDNYREVFVGTDQATADAGVFIDYINKDDLDQAIESFDAILGDIEMGGEVNEGSVVGDGDSIRIG